jgi:hypothetical protein
MSNTPQPIQFLLYQLKISEENRERFNKLTNVKCRLVKNRDLCFLHEDYKEDEEWYFSDYTYHGMGDVRRKEIVETCLRSYENKAVLAVLEASRDLLVEAYVHCRYNQGHYQAIQALHDKMLELVPEYREFLNSKK